MPWCDRVLRYEHDVLASMQHRAPPPPPTWHPCSTIPRVGAPFIFISSLRLFLGNAVFLGFGFYNIRGSYE